MKQINKDMTIREVLSICPDSAAIFAGYGMFCIGCPSAQAETVEEACQAHGIDCEALITDINAQAEKA
ncbi:MAG: DUF1858 domain-containing protein [Christensenellaceae bacterium]|jgi:hydrid cluster protein-associated redox disulfide domain|nr:DUF1858 domain-containing protein [Christensenellaceae bacterium]MBS6564740.1 DUF1858 domain-containing protein [Clostridiales bacterium]PWL99898.1 MAG: disulfide oxidoreductase [Selenomonadales bacterium]